MADIEDVLDIDRQSFPTPAREELYRRELTQNPLAHYQVVTAPAAPGRQVVGYAGFWHLGVEVHISTIAVAPEWRGRGLGDGLFLNMLLHACRLGASEVTLEVRRSNVTAQTMYRKHQFAVVGHRRRYYRDSGEDALIMTLLLSPETCRRLRGEAQALVKGQSFPS